MTMENQRSNNPRDEEAEAMEECTFEPQTFSSNKGKVGKRTVDDLLKWGLDKRFKLANQRLRKFEGTSYTFQPDIDGKSTELAQKKCQGRVENRLMEAGKKKDQKIKDLYEKLQGELFKPDFNLNSKWILKRKQKEELVKKENGRTKNIDYYEAIPKCTLDKQDSTLQNRYLSNISAHKSPGRSKSRRKGAYTSPIKGNISARSRSAATTTKKERRDIETLRVIKESQRKNSELIPSYVSPYNKSMLGSGLPLKTIINKTNANKKKKRVQKQRNRSKSLSKIDDIDNGTMVGMMRKAFQNEVEHSHLYKKLPIRKNRKSKYQTPRRNKSSKRKNTGKSRSHSKNRTSSKPVRSSSYHSARKSVHSDRSPNSINQLKKLIYKDKSHTKTTQPSQNSYISPSKSASKRSRKKSKSRSRRKKKLTKYEKDQEYKKKLKMIGNTYMYQALENAKVGSSSTKVVPIKTDIVDNYQKYNLGGNK